MQISRKQNICQAVDDSKGKKKVWRVAAFDIHLLPETDHGIFYAGDSYIILYTSDKVPGGIIYYWLGNHSTIDEKATAAMFVNKIDEMECKGKATQMRVIQFKEPEHFLKMFGNVLVILKGGVESGFKSPRANLNDFFKHDHSCQMFQIRGRRIVEVNVEAKNLNSNDIFFVKTNHKQGYTWIGKALICFYNLYKNFIIKGASREEQETALKIPEMFDLTENKQIAEGDEPTAFWYLLGGKEAYAKGERLENPSPEYASRLFHCSNARGKFVVEEIVDFTQQDLESDDVMILDTFDEIYVWLGQNSNIEEKKAALDTVLRYVAADKSGRTEENTNLLVVKQKFEPTTFKAHFGIWDEHLWDNKLGYEKLKELISRNVDFIHDTKNEPLQVRQMEAEFTKTHPIEFLRTKTDQLPFGVDAANKEKHLNDDDFEKVFGMSRKEYDELPKWRQIEHKKRVGLF
uniref:HP domain-containing protein n=1 Tax=Panagrolaimus sp. ES5 TaxID=591445 RepID=A0AC34FN51_9BILA